MVASTVLFKGPYIRYVGGKGEGAEDFCGGHEILGIY